MKRPRVLDLQADTKNLRTPSVVSSATRTATRGTMNSALSSSLAAETDSFQERLKRAEMALQPVAETPLLDQNSSNQTLASNGLPTNAAPLSRTPRVVRDAFTMPEDDYALIEQTQKRCLNNAVRLSKSEALRAGLQLLAALDDENLLAAAERLQKVPVGRPRATLRETEE